MVHEKQNRSRDHCDYRCDHYWFSEDDFHTRQRPSEPRSSRTGRVTLSAKSRRTERDRQLRRSYRRSKARICSRSSTSMSRIISAVGPLRNSSANSRHLASLCSSCCLVSVASISLRRSDGNKVQRIRRTTVLAEEAETGRCLPIERGRQPRRPRCRTVVGFKTITRAWYAAHCRAICEESLCRRRGSLRHRRSVKLGGSVLETV
jgi:hypothetical protein